MLKAWKRYRSLSSGERKTLWRALALLPFVGLGLRLFGLQRMLRALESNPRNSIDFDSAAVTTRMVEAAARRGPYRPACLPRSLALWAILRWQGHPAELRLGVRKKEGALQAHAWVELDGRPLNDRLGVGERFAPLETPAGTNPAPAFSPEGQILRLILRSDRTPASLEEARRRIPDLEGGWEALLAVAQREHLSGLLFTLLREADWLTPEARASLHRSYRETGMRNTLLLHDLGEAAALLESEDIPVLILKGAALVVTIYSSLGQRPMSDLDILVRPEDAPAAIRTLARLGYHGADPETQSGAILEFENEILLQRDSPLRTALEVHWGLIDSPYHQSKIETGWFWDSSVKLADGIDQAALRMRGLGTEGLLLHLCAHLALHHSQAGQPSLLWLEDIARVLHACGDGIHWELLFGRAEAYDLVLPLQTVLRRAAAELGAPIPADAGERLSALRPSPQERRVFRRLTRPDQHVAQRFVNDLIELPGWQRRLVYAGQQLFPSAEYMRRRYALSNDLHLPWAYLFRWLRGLASALGFTRRASPRDRNPSA